MKSFLKMKFVVPVVAILVAAIWIASASAATYTDTGTLYRNGSVLPNHLIKAFNNCTGTNGSTFTNSAGQWSFSGITAGCSYNFHADDCVNHVFWSGSRTVSPQPASNVNGLTVNQTNQGSC